MKKVILTLLLGTTVYGDAKNHVVVYVDGIQYQCGQGQGGTDPKCLEKIGNYCDDNTTFSSNDCFEKASQACKNARPGYSDCVISTSDYCDDNTTLSSNECFLKGISACSYDASAITALMAASRRK